jgi:hypothetical protein
MHSQARNLRLSEASPNRTQTRLTIEFNMPLQALYFLRGFEAILLQVTCEGHKAHAIRLRSSTGRFCSVRVRDCAQTPASIARTTVYTGLENISLAQSPSVTSSPSHPLLPAGTQQGFWCGPARLFGISGAATRTARNAKTAGCKCPGRCSASHAAYWRCRCALIQGLLRM